MFRGVRFAVVRSQIVVIATNDPKKKDANKDEKFLANANIIRVITCNIAHLCPKAFVAIVTNPVNSCVPVVAEVFKACGTLNPRKIFGVTTLTSVRARSFIGQHCNVNPKEIELPIIGGNCEHTCVPILSCCNVKIPLEKYEELVLKIIEAEIDLRKIKNSTHGSTLAMAWSASRFVNCLCKAIIGEVKPRVNTFVHCNITDTKYLNCPVILGKDGVHEVLQLPKMNEFENCLLSKALPILKEEIKRGEDFIAKFVKDNGGGSGSEKQSTTKCDTGKKTDSKDSKKK